MKLLNEYLSDYAARYPLHGNIYVEINGRQLLRKSYGQSSIELSKKNTISNKFKIGSITKQFTAYLVLKAALGHAFELEHPVQNYVKGLDKHPPITIHQLLSHQSGLQNYTAHPKYRECSRQRTNSRKIISRFNRLPLKFAPGKAWEYSNSNYVTLGVLLETVTRKSYEDLLREHIFNPLHMKNSGLCKDLEIVKNRSCGHSIHNDMISHSHAKYNSWLYSTGGIYSTVDDLWKWMDFLFESDNCDSKIRAAMLKNHNPHGSGKKYGYGMAIQRHFNTKVFAHDGWVDGFQSAMMYAPKYKCKVIVLSNFDHQPCESIALTLMDIAVNRKRRIVRTPPRYELSLEEKKKILGVYSDQNEQFKVTERNKDIIIDFEKYCGDASTMSFYPISASTMRHTSFDYSLKFDIGETSTSLFDIKKRNL